MTTSITSGIDALQELFVRQAQRDAAAGLRTEAFVSGYEGSPLAGLDLAMLKRADRFEAAGVHLAPGLNEDLAATAVWGSQTVPQQRAGLDGVVGYWYGKAPGVDRSADVFRHANVIGAHPCGGALILAGDDPACKSSTLPSSSTSILAALGIPVLYPGSVGDIVRLGLHGVALSRFTGCWVALKLDTDLLDGYTSSAEVGDPTVVVPEHRLDDGTIWEHRQARLPVPPYTVQNAPDVQHHRLAAARAYAAANDLNPVQPVAADVAPGRRVGLICAGTVDARLDVALERLGFTGDRAGAVGRLRLALVHPLEDDAVRAFARGLDYVLVVEEGRDALAEGVRAALYAEPTRPGVLGRVDERGAPLLPSAGELTVDTLVDRLGATLERLTGVSPAVALERPRPLLPLLGARTPFFCSGCPHNRSTTIPEGALMGAGIGCHGMVSFIEDEQRPPGSMTHMGGEGAAWIGQAAFSEHRHLIQNVGDGTFFHSASLALRAAVAARVNVTYKLLYNGTVAMTGGQDVIGHRSLPAVCSMLLAEGAARVVVCTDDPRGVRKANKLPRPVRIRHRDDLEKLQQELAEVPGVTVIVYAQGCAAEARRMRKSGKLPTPARRVVINERVCEGCGDCGAKSNCLSVQPVETEYGRKTLIDQGTCNYDESCLTGDCPSFVTVTPVAAKVAVRPDPPASPAPPVHRDATGQDLILAGVGGTGVVTTSGLLSRAAVADGWSAVGLDQTGLSQKAGPVVSHLHLGDEGAPRRVEGAGADLLLAFDALVAADESVLRSCAPGRTAVVVGAGLAPSGRSVRNVRYQDPTEAALLERIADSVDRERLLVVPARQIAEQLVGDPMQANTVLAAAALQAGFLELSLGAFEIAFVGSARRTESVEAAIGWGRAFVEDRAAVLRALRRSTTRDDRRHRAASVSWTDAVPQLVGLGAEAKSRIDALADDLVGYQGTGYARRFVESLAPVAAEQDLAVAAARGLHKVFAYKDEYEVARLYLDPAFEDRLRAEFGTSKVKYHLHPPVLRALGMDRKLILGPWFKPVFRFLYAARRLRGTPFDPFGRAHLRREERRLREEYVALVRWAATELERGTDPGRLTDVLSRIDSVRGYEEIKLGNLAEYRQEIAVLLAEQAPGVRTTAG